MLLNACGVIADRTNTALMANESLLKSRGLHHYEEKRLLKTLSLLLAVFATMSICRDAQAVSDMAKGWAQTQSSGSDNMDANRYWLAEPQLKEALSIAESSGTKDLHLAKSLGELGRYYTIRGQFSIAEPYLEKELLVKEDVLGPCDCTIVPAMGKLLMFYLKYGNARKAPAAADDMLAMIDGKLAEPLDGADSKTKYKKGMTLEAWAGTAAPVARDPLLEWAIACDAVGNVYKSQNNWPMAERFFQAALDLKTTILGKSHLSLANSYDALGTVLMEKKEYAQATSYLVDALSITEKINSLDSPEVYLRLDKLAKCYMADGKYTEAEALYKRAQSFWKNEPSTHGTEARCWYALGSMYIDQKRYAEGAACLRRGLQLAESFNGPCSIGLVPYYLRYAYALYYLGQRAEAAEMTARAHAISPPEIKVVPLVATEAPPVDASYFKKNTSTSTAINDVSKADDNKILPDKSSAQKLDKSATPPKVKSAQKKKPVAAARTRRITHRH